MSTVRTESRDIAQPQTGLDGRSQFTFAELGEAVWLSDLMDDGILRLERDALTNEEKLAVVEQALLLMSSFYVHLAAKRALYAIDPIGALHNLRSEIGFAHDQDKDAVGLRKEKEFHDRLTAIFVALRDRHTNYYLPQPFRRTLAFLPFLLEPAREATGTLYLVTKIADPIFEDDVFTLEGGRRLEVTHWNGMPIERAVARSGDLGAGANRSARIARGLFRMTFRWLGLTTGPDEEWVDLTFTVAGESHVKRFHWWAVQRPARADDGGIAPPGRQVYARAVDAEGEWIRMVKERLYGNRSSTKRSSWKKVADGRASYRVRSRNSTAYGHLRIFTFNHPSPAKFVSEIREILETAPAAGLVIDIRGNPGGSMIAAEALLPLFSPVPVEGQGLQFINSAAAIALARKVDSSARFELSLGQAEATAAPFITSPFLEWPRRSSRSWQSDQVYQGPVVVIVDANSYSAAEVFAAGMKDNDLATIVGVDAQTGGGGANVWEADLIRRRCGQPELLRKLAHGAGFDVALRRTTRVGDLAGLPVEDMGVVVAKADQRPFTAEDVLADNGDLFTCAVEKLPTATPFVTVEEQAGTCMMSFSGLDRIDVYAGATRIGSVSAREGTTGVQTEPLPATKRRTLRLFGFKDPNMQPVTSYRWQRATVVGSRPAPER